MLSQSFSEKDTRPWRNAAGEVSVSVMNQYCVYSSLPMTKLERADKTVTFFNKLPPFPLTNEKFVKTFFAVSMAFTNKIFEKLFFKSFLLKLTC